MTAAAVDERSLFSGLTWPPSAPATSFPLADRGRVVLADDPCEAGFPGAGPEYAGIYLHARYFDPQLGTFLSPDPIGVEGGLNEYAYAGGDPVNWADRTGLQSVFQVEVNIGSKDRDASPGYEAYLEVNPLTFAGSAGTGGSLLWFLIERLFFAGPGSGGASGSGSTTGNPPPGPEDLFQPRFGRDWDRPQSDPPTVEVAPPIPPPSSPPPGGSGGGGATGGGESRRPSPTGDWVVDSLQCAAGVCDNLSFGLSSALRTWTDPDEIVDTSSDAYTVGYWGAFSVSAGRLAYAGSAKALSMYALARSRGGADAIALARSAVANRNALKIGFRVGLLPNYRIRPFGRYWHRYHGDPGMVINRAGRTNPWLNGPAGVGFVHGECSAWGPCKWHA